MKKRIITETMSRQERISLFHSTAMRFFNSPKFRDATKKRLKQMRKYKSSTGSTDIPFGGLKFTVVLWKDGAFEIFADIGIKTFEFAKLTLNFSVAVYTQHFLERYNQRMNLNKDSLKEVLLAFSKNEAMTIVNPVIYEEAKLLQRTKNGFSHGRVQYLKDKPKAIMYFNTWFDLNVEDEAIKAAKDFDQFNELNAKDKDELVADIYTSLQRRASS